MDRLTELTERKGFRRKVEAVLRDLAGHGWQPTIPKGSALRSRADQERKVAAGVSKTLKSKHLPGSDGLARAADIVPVPLLWQAPLAYWLQLGASATAHGLGWGGFFGLGPWDRLKLSAALRLKRWDYAGRIGWDPAHVESR